MCTSRQPVGADMTHERVARTPTRPVRAEATTTFNTCRMPSLSDHRRSRRWRRLRLHVLPQPSASPCPSLIFDSRTVPFLFQTLCFPVEAAPFKSSVARQLPCGPGAQRAKATPFKACGRAHGVAIHSASPATSFSAAVMPREPRNPAQS